MEPHHKHLTRTTFHIVAHREQVQKRVLWALRQPTIEQVIGALQLHRASAIRDVAANLPSSATPPTAQNALAGRQPRAPG